MENKPLRIILTTIQWYLPGDSSALAAVCLPAMFYRAQRF
jgi:hypothetical protein